MNARHPAHLKKQLRTILERDGALTTVQAERLGLSRAVEYLELSPVERTVRTRSTQSGSLADLEFVVSPGLEEPHVGSDLLHRALQVELASRMVKLLPGFEWLPVNARGRDRARFPDVEMRHLETGATSWVEVDVGYSRQRVVNKLLAASRGGYASVIWGTSIRTRVQGVIELAKELNTSGQLPSLDGVVVYFVDCWSLGNPYRPRPYSDRPNMAAVNLRRDRASGSGARVKSRRGNG